MAEELPDLKSLQKDAWHDMQKAGNNPESAEYKESLQRYNTSTTQIQNLYNYLVQVREERGLPKYINAFDDIRIKNDLGIALNEEEKDLQRILNRYGSIDGESGEYIWIDSKNARLELEKNPLAVEYMESTGSSNMTADFAQWQDDLITREHSEAGRKAEEEAKLYTGIVQSFGFRLPGHQSTFNRIMRNITKIATDAIPYVTAAAAAVVGGAALAGAGSAAGGGAAAAGGAGSAAGGSAAAAGGLTAAAAGGLTAAEIAAATPGAFAGAGSVLGGGAAASGLAAGGATAAALGPTTAAEGIAATEAAIASGSMTGLYTGATTAEAIGATEAAIASGSMTGLTGGAGAGLAGGALGPTVEAAASGSLASDLFGGAAATTSPLTDAAKTLGKKVIISGASSLIGDAITGEAPSIYNGQPSGTSLGGSDGIEFMQKQLEDWENIYGPTQKALADYYEGLEPDSYAANNISNIHKYYQDTQAEIDRQLAQRGLSDSGAQAQSIVDIQTATAKDSSEARRLAPSQVANEQQSFLSLGLGQKNSLQNTTAAAYNAEATRNLEAAKIDTELKINKDKQKNELIGEIAKATVPALEDVDLFSADTYGGLL